MAGSLHEARMSPGICCRGGREPEDRLGQTGLPGCGLGVSAICCGCHWGLWAISQVLLQADGKTVGYAGRCGSLQLCGKCGGTTLLGPGKGPGGDGVRGNPSTAMLTCLPRPPTTRNRTPPVPGARTTGLNPPPAPESLPGLM
jgi:hypothetical protein